MSVISQKRKSQNECFKKTKHAKFSGKQRFCTPDVHINVCLSGGKKSLLFAKFDLLCFLETPVLRLPFLLYYGQNIISLIKLLFSCHSGNQIFTYKFYICSSLDIMNNQNSFQLALGFLFDSLLNCLCFPLLFTFSNIWNN